jgi:hypothetical protein
MDQLKQAEIEIGTSSSATITIIDKKKAASWTLARASWFLDNQHQILKGINCTETSRPEETLLIKVYEF